MRDPPTSSERSCNLLENLVIFDLQVALLLTKPLTLFLISANISALKIDDFMSVIVKQKKKRINQKYTNEKDMNKLIR